MDFVTDHTVRFIREIREVQTFEQLADFMSATLQQLQIRHFALIELGGRKKPDSTVLTNFPPEWAVRYFHRQYENCDPVHVKLIRTREPFAWSSLQEEGYLKGKSRTVFHEGSEFGLRDGCTFPIVNTNGYTAVVSYSAERIEDDPRVFPALQLISLYFHGKYKELCLEAEPALPDLTQRERECLTWAGIGKTDWEIGEILSIRETTVHSHIENAKRKLGVTTRIQAVVESLRHHLIHI